MSTTGPIRVGIAGLGRSGWNIHAKTLQKMPEQYRVVAVMDLDPARRAEAETTLGCRSYDAFEPLAADREVDLLVVASPNRLHTEHAIAAMRAGRNVVVEKPFAMNSGDADRTIAVAKETGRLLAPFQNRRYESHFLKVKEIIDSGLLGQVVLIRLAWHGFGRRWDWQTLSEFGGGSLNNNGPHVVDHALQLLGPGEPEDLEMFVDLRNGLAAGDCEDHVKITMRRKDGGPTVDFELTSLAACGQERWQVMGTAGGLRGTTSKLEWKWVDWSAMPERRVDRTPTADRSYNHEQIPWQTDSWQAPADEPSFDTRFYRDLFETIRNGKPQWITPESVRRQIALIERAHAMCPVEQIESNAVTRETEGAVR